MAERRRPSTGIEVEVGVMGRGEHSLQLLEAVPLTLRRVWRGRRRLATSNSYGTTP